MSSLSKLNESKDSSIFNQAWGTTWRKALISLPRLIPDAALRFTSPDGPHPKIIKLPSRGKHTIPLYVFIPPRLTGPSPAPKSAVTKTISLPVLLDFHGGGFVQGSCLEQAPFCAKLCRDLNCIAISVDYRLGPAAQFPAAIEDAEDVLNAILDPTKPGFRELRSSINTAIPNPSAATINIDTSRLALSGFSSGGSLALNLALSIPTTVPLVPEPWPSLIPPSHNTPIPLLLFFPSLDTRLRPNERELPPGLDPPTGFLAGLDLESELMPTYLPAHMTAHPRASPVLVSVAHGQLHTSARILLVLPEYDSLTKSNKAWGERVRNEGRGDDLEIVDVEKMAHGWTQFPDGWLDEVAKQRKRECIEKAVAFMKSCWETGAVGEGRGE